ncbi:MAG: CoA transferase [Methanomassiliicoccales archaeon]|nr:MAG: CoA transferase [Methanomassiliicoccales archaeon]
MEGEDEKLPLTPYRVLDLTTGGCLYCAKILADLGADVIKIENPGGDPARNIGPFYKDVPHPEKSLFWFAFNTNKRSITLDLQTADGQEIFQQLVETADFLIESFAPSYMDKLGLGYEVLSEINPRLIMTSITPFGQTGPYANYLSSDLVTWAMGGYMFLCGDPDRAPVWISLPQASIYGGSQAAAGTMIAHWYRERTGEGQSLDVSIQECIICFLNQAMQNWDLNEINSYRVGYKYMTGGGPLTMGHRCRDGYVTCVIMGGAVKAQVHTSKVLTNWLAEEGNAPEWLKDFDWEHDYDAMKHTPELVDRVESCFKEFFNDKTKKELYEKAVESRIMFAPLNDVQDIVEDRQLSSRDFWVKVEHPELGDVITYCGPVAKLTETPITSRRRPPLIGEHNDEVYGELGLSRNQILFLKQGGVI